MKSKVYMVNNRTSYEANMLQKFEVLIKESGLLEYDFKDKFVAIKIHFGEYGNLAYIKPQYLKILGDVIKEKGGLPFLTDCSTLYSGSRSDALSHLNTALANGFSKDITGMHIVIGDGLKGNDYDDVKVTLKHCSSVKIGRAIMESDIIITMNHFKGHEQAGFGGALKNIGMGCGSKIGKLEMHSGLKPIILNDKCISCGQCVKNCNQCAIILDNKAKINYDKCVGCGECIVVCKKEAITQNTVDESKLLNEKIAEYTYGVLKDKLHFHFNFLTDISPNCDCWPMNDAPIVPNIGILASSDPVAIDYASAHLVNKEEALANTFLTEKKNYKAGYDKFKCMHNNADWESGLIYAEELSLGKKDFEIINISERN